MLPRRAFLESAAGVAVATAAGYVAPSVPASELAAATPAPAPPAARPGAYDTHAAGIRILPGQWRPHYPWEHIVWISPAWPSQDYLWLDFPEALFTDQGLLFLSHVNPAVPAVYPDWPRVAWRQRPDEVAFERRLPNGVRFGGRVTKQGERSVGLELHLQNGSGRPLKDITLQTCAYLRGIREFADFTRSNKFLHVSGQGWMRLDEAAALPANAGPYRVGWRRSGKLLADWPVLVTVSSQAPRLVAMTWREHTLSLVSNPNHPCMHADPHFKDLEPGERATIRGQIEFFEGKLADFDYAGHFGP